MIKEKDHIGFGIIAFNLGIVTFFIVFDLYFIVLIFAFLY